MPARKKATSKARTTKKTTAAKSKTTARSTRATRTARATSTRATASRSSAANKARTTAKRATVSRATRTTKATAFSTNFPNKAISQKQTKSQIFAEIAEVTGISKSDVKNVFNGLRNVIERHVKPKGSGEVTIPELGIKVRRVVKKATKARMGRNPFTGEEIEISAKPARKGVKVTALKALKALVD